MKGSRVRTARTCENANCPAKRAGMRTAVRRTGILICPVLRIGFGTGRHSLVGEIMNTRRVFVAAALLFVLSAAAVRSTAQENARKVFEAGKYQAVVEQTASDGSPAAQYLKGLAHLKLNQPD